MKDQLRLEMFEAALLAHNHGFEGTSKAFLDMANGCIGSVRTSEILEKLTELKTPEPLPLAGQIARPLALRGRSRTGVSRGSWVA